MGFLDLRAKGKGDQTTKSREMIFCGGRATRDPICRKGPGFFSEGRDDGVGGFKEIDFFVTG